MTKRPVVAIDARLANAPRRAGVGNYCRELLRALPEAAPHWTPRIYLDQPPRPDFPLGADQAEFRVLPPARYWASRKLGAALRAEPPTVFLSPVTQVPPRCAAPAVVTVHDLAFLAFPDHFTWRRRWLARWQTWMATRRATHLLADSEATRAGLQRHYRVPPERVTVTLAGCGPEFRAPIPDAEVARVRRAHKLPPRYALYVGRLQPRKNLPRLIAAFSALIARRPELPHHLVIAGDEGWLAASTHAAAANAPARDRIRMLGFAPEADLPALMRGADALALPSLWEGFGLPALEAMSVGAAVLAANCSSLPEVVGEAGVLVDPYSEEAIAAGLERLLTDDAFREQCAARGIARAAQLTWRAAAGRVAGALDKAAGLA